VSRLFPERLTIRLSPAEVSLGEKKIPCDPALGTEPWQGAVQALQKLELPRGSVGVILSNAFVRYALVPWSDALSGEAEETAYVRHHFLRVHGERAKGWTFRASPALARAPRLCSAIDTTLLSALKAALARKAKLVSVQPALMAVFNRCRGGIPASGAWLALVEPERACIGLHAKGGWQAVSNGKMSARGEWLPLLELERHRLAGDAPELVLLHSDETVPAEAPGWKVERLAA
jgi:hypothetical protein